MRDSQQNALLGAPSPLIDIGVNLTNERFNGKIAEVVAQSLEANVTNQIITGTSFASSKAALALCERYPEQFRSTVGIHPHDASEFNSSAHSNLRDLLQSTYCVAVGETGLDFNRNFSTPQDQEKAFEAQLELAIEFQKPLFMHERDAFERQHEILKSYRDDITDGVIHCFTGSKQALFGYLDLGLYIGITGWICDERRGTDLQALVHNIPQDRLMIETDAPYLLPRNMTSKPKDRTNRPAYLPWVLKELSLHTGLSELDLACKTSDNARRFFRLPEHFAPANEVENEPVSDFYRL
ncbi:TatD family hydrolase [Oceanospirillum sp.]|uniref:TatD family hydrolase n=1 Tax=Oceanospirillum sp. TaxID=2021254 RepID=UPI003A8CCD0F